MSWMLRQQSVPSDLYFANVSLLLHGDGAIVDSSPSPKIITPYGNVQINTTVTDAFGRTGVGVIAFDGTAGSWLAVPDSDDFTFGSGDFTIECRIHNNTTGQFRHIVGQGNSGANGATVSFYFYKSNANKLVGAVFSGTTGYVATSSADLPLNDWAHVAFVRYGNTTTVYINGAAGGTANVTGVTVNNSANQVRVGAAGEYTSDTFSGYIDELRITKGVARYTSNFTPSTEPFPDIR